MCNVACPKLHSRTLHSSLLPPSPPTWKHTHCGQTRQHVTWRAPPTTAYTAALPKRTWKRRRGPAPACRRLAAWCSATAQLAPASLSSMEAQMSRTSCITIWALTAAAGEGAVTMGKRQAPQGLVQPQQPAKPTATSPARLLSDVGIIQARHAVQQRAAVGANQALRQRAGGKGGAAVSLRALGACCLKRLQLQSWHGAAVCKSCWLRLRSQSSQTTGKHPSPPARCRLGR